MDRDHMRIEFLLADQQIKSRAVANILRKIPEIMEDARRLEAAGGWGVTPDANREGAIRAAMTRYLAPFPYDRGDKMHLMSRLLESAICLIDWTAVAERVGLTSSEPSTPSTDSPPAPPGETPTCSADPT